MSDNDPQFCDLVVTTRELGKLMRGKKRSFSSKDSFASIVFCGIF